MREKGQEGKSKMVRSSEVYNVKELGEALGMSPSSVRRSVLKKGCPYSMVGKKIQISGALYKKWVELKSRSVFSADKNEIMENSLDEEADPSGGAV